MSEIYILDEIPIINSPPIEQREIYLDVPSLSRLLYSRECGATIYGSDSSRVVVHACQGKPVFDFWMSQLPVALMPRLYAIGLLNWISHRKVTTSAWSGKAVVVSSYRGSDIHFLVYSSTLDVSLDLEVTDAEGSNITFQRGLDYLSEIEFYT